MKKVALLAFLLLAGCTNGKDPVSPEPRVTRKTCGPDQDTITVVHSWVCLGPITAKH